MTSRLYNEGFPVEAHGGAGDTLLDGRLLQRDSRRGYVRRINRRFARGA
jgi:hypothetical protein